MRNNSHGSASICHKIIPKIFIMLLQISENWSSHNLEVLEIVKWLEEQEFQNQYMKKVMIQIVLFYKKCGNTLP